MPRFGSDWVFGGKDLSSIWSIFYYIFGIGMILFGGFISDYVIFFCE
jgi:hypothetical protein